MSSDFDIGQAHVLMVKSAAGGKPATTHSLSGELYLSKSGWLLLQVPNALVRGAFAALNEPGVELPPDGPDGGLNAHISVIRPEELEEQGLTGDDIKERGQHFKYTLGPIQTVTPKGWDEMSKVWFIKVNSPELKKLRRTYGMTSLPKNGEFEFHISIGVRRKGVLSGSTTRKAASLIHGGNISEYFIEGWTDPRGREAGLCGRGSGPVVRAAGAEGVPARQGSGHADGVHQRKVASAGDDEEDAGPDAGDPPGVPVAEATTAQEQAPTDVLAELRRAKYESDRRNYAAKYGLLRQMMRDNPGDFVVDSPVGQYHGITHAPTGFQYHVPQMVYDDLVKESSLGYAVRDSDIHGQGTFATRNYEPGDRVGLALQFVKDDDGTKEFDRTVLGRFVNYQPEGNVVLQEQDGNLYLHASKPISADEEMVTQPYDDELAPFGPLTINEGYKQAFDMSGSWYGGAAQDYMNNLLAGRGQLWQPKAGIWGNIKRHLGGIRNLASGRIQQAESFNRFQSAMDPNHALRQFTTFLSGQRRPLVRHPVDAILHGRFGT
jgi:hypothetical protein